MHRRPLARRAYPARAKAAQTARTVEAACRCNRNTDLCGGTGLTDTAGTRKPAATSEMQHHSRGQEKADYSLLKRLAIGFF